MPASQDVRRRTTAGSRPGPHPGAESVGPPREFRSPHRYDDVGDRDRDQDPQDAPLPCGGLPPAGWGLQWRRRVTASDACGGRESVRGASPAGPAPFACAGIGVQHDGRAIRTVAAAPRTLAAILEMAVLAVATRRIGACPERQARGLRAEVSGIRLLACLAAVLAGDNADRAPGIAEGHAGRRALDLPCGVPTNEFLERRDQAPKQSARRVGRARGGAPRRLGGPCGNSLVRRAAHRIQDCWTDGCRKNRQVSYLATSCA